MVCAFSQSVIGFSAELADVALGFTFVLLGCSTCFIPFRCFLLLFFFFFSQLEELKERFLFLLDLNADLTT